jgi:polyhydroxyalkanoate synthesis regulator phasin
LTQVISEREKKQGGFVPRTVLAGLVQAGGATLDVVRRAMLLPLDLLRQVDDEIRQRIETLIRQGDLPEEEGRRLLEKLLSLGRHPLDEAAIGREVEKALTERGVPDRSDLQRLMEQIDALTRKVEEL